VRAGAAVLCLHLAGASTAWNDDSGYEGGGGVVLRHMDGAGTDWTFQHPNQINFARSARSFGRMSRIPDASQMIMRVGVIKNRPVIGDNIDDCHDTDPFLSASFYNFRHVLSVHPELTFMALLHFANSNKLAAWW
jgi:hypothetical protein